MNIKKMRLVYMKASQLEDHPGNWRTHPEEQETVLTALIGEVGFSTAILYNERTGRIVDGHLRKKVAVKNGDPEVPVLIGDWTEAEEVELLVSIDPIAGYAVPDPEKLDASLHSVQTKSEDVAAFFEDIGKEAGLDWIEGAEEESNGCGAPDYQVVVLCSSEEEADETKAKLSKMGYRVR